MTAAAAFYDLEGTLVGTNLVHALLFHAKNQRGLLRSALQSAATVLSIPLFAAADVYSRHTVNELLFARYRGQTEDRLRFLADGLFDEVLKPSLRPGARDLIERSRALGLRPVIVTGALDISIRPLLTHLGVTDYAANRLEFVDGIATGRLLPPVFSSAAKATWIRQFAAREGIDLNASYAYSDSISDLPMLSLVGHPAAVNPELRLRTLARQHQWPVLDLQ